MTAQELVTQASHFIVDAINTNKKLNIKDIHVEQLCNTEIKRLLDVFVKLDKDMVSQYGENYRDKVTILAIKVFSVNSVKRLINNLNKISNMNISELTTVSDKDIIQTQVIMLALMFVMKGLMDENNNSSGGKNEN